MEMAGIRKTKNQNDPARFIDKQLLQKMEKWPISYIFWDEKRLHRKHSTMASMLYVRIFLTIKPEDILKASEAVGRLKHAFGS